MTSTSRALELVLATNLRYATEQIPLRHAIGRILRQDVCAERDLPPFDRVTMDGIAIAHISWQQGKRNFTVQGIQAAGEPAGRLREPDSACVQVMTGTPLPEQADCVIPIELLNIEDGVAHVDPNASPDAMQHVHRRASDHREGDALLHEGRRLGSQDIAVIASCGLAKVTVSQSPSVAIVSTGDELVDGGRPIETHQVRMSLHHAMQARLSRHGCHQVDAVHIVDNPQQTEQKLGQLLKDYDIVAICGGVSKGKFDFVPGALENLGVRMAFDKVSQRPGKPFRFGLSTQNTAVFAFPGNPISALVCFYRYLLPFVDRASGSAPQSAEFAVLASDIDFTPNLTFYAPAELQSHADGNLMARPVRYNTSGSMSTLGQSDGFIELDANQDCFPTGTVVPVVRW